MVQRVPLLAALSLAGVSSVFLLLLFGYYLPRIKFHHPICISVIYEDDSKPENPVQMLGKTPLGTTVRMEQGKLECTSPETFLYSEIFLDLSSISPEFISEIRVRLGEREFPIVKNQITGWYLQKENSLFPLSLFVQDDERNLSKLHSLLKLDIVRFAAVFLWNALVISLIGVAVVAPFALAGLFLLTKRWKYIPAENATPSRHIFFICLIFFLALQSYGIYFYQLRVQMDASTDMLWQSSERVYLSSFPPIFRYAYSLNKWMLKPGFLAHLPITCIGKMYCFNDAVFHLSIAFLIIFFTHRYDYAAAVLAAPVLISKINFYYIGTELFLSGSIMLLYVSVYKHMKHGVLRTVVLFISLFFIVWSHPVTLIVLIVFLAGLYNSRAQLLKDKLILAFMAVNVTARLLLLDDYDHQKLGILARGAEFSYLLNITGDYLAVYWYIVVLGIAGFYVAAVVLKTPGIYKALFVLPFILYFLSAQQLNVADSYFSKYAYPVHLFLLAQGLVFATQACSRYKYLLIAGIIIILTAGIWSTIAKHHGFFMKRVVLFKALNTLCRQKDPEHSKWFVSNDLLAETDPYGSYTESIVYSAFFRQPLTVQVVRGDSTLHKFLSTLPP